MDIVRCATSPSKRSHPFGMNINTEHIVKRCLTLGLSKSDAKAVAKLISRKMTHRGPAGIDQVKDVFQSILCYHFNLPPKPYVGLKFDYPKDLLFLKGYPLDTQIRVAFAHRFIVFDGVTSRQATKFLSAVSRPEPDSLALHSARHLCRSGFRELRLTGRGRSYDSPLDLSMWMSHSSASELTIFLRKEIRKLASVRHTDLVGLEKVIPLPLYLRAMLLPPSPSEDEFVGNISATQEPGGKLRVFASPLVVLQCLLTPLFQCLMEMLSQIPNDCTFVQERGVDYALERMMSGQTVYSVDLSNATDSFPLELQLDWMKLAGINPEQLSLFERISRGRWRVSSDLVAAGFPEYISWSVGQPLGLRPSFPAFALTHHMLVRGICKELGIDPDASYAILGDDILIFREDLYLAYRNTMNSLGCKVADDKTFVSASFAEFAGYVCYTKPTCRELMITDDFQLTLTKGFEAFSIRAGKFRLPGLNTIRNLCLLLKRSIKNEFPLHMRPLIHVLETLPQPYGGAGLFPDQIDPLTIKVKEIMDSYEFNERSGRKRDDRWVTRSEAWAAIISDYVRYDQGLYQSLRPEIRHRSTGSKDAAYQMLALANTFFPGFNRANALYHQQMTNDAWLEKLYHMCKGSVGRSETNLSKARLFFEVSEDTPPYRLYILIDNLYDEALGSYAKDESLHDDLRTIKRAVRRALRQPKSVSSTNS